MNRFDQPIGNRSDYISHYAPMPLEAFTKLAQQKQGEFDSAINDIEGTKGLLKINADPVNYDYRDNLINKLNTNLTDFAGKVAREGYTPANKVEWLKIKNDVLNNPDRLRLEEQAKDYKLYEGDLKKQKAEGTYLSDMDSYAGLKGSGDKYTPWSYQGLEGLLDYSKAAKDVMGKIAPEGFDRESLKIDPKTGDIVGVTEGKEGVVANKLFELAKGKADNFLTTKEGVQFAKRMRNAGHSEDAIRGEAIDMIYNANSEQIGLKTKHGESYQYAPDGVRTAAAIANAGLGQVVMGNTAYDLTQEAPSSVKNRMNVDKDGNVHIRYDRSYTATGAGLYRTFTKENPMSDKERKEIANYVANAAKAINYKGDYTSVDYDKILTEYNKAVKSVSYDTKLNPIEQNIVKGDMLTDRRNYVYRDAEGKIMATPPPLTNDSFEPNTRTYADGKSRIIFSYYEDPKDPKSIKFATAEPLAEEDSKYHSLVGNVQKSQMDYFKNGTVSDEAAKRANMSAKMYNRPIDEEHPKAEAISVVTSPVGNKMYIVSADPNNRKEQYYIEAGVDANGQKYRHRINNLPELMKLINADWYSTEEGKMAATVLASKNEQYKAILGK